MNNSRHKTATVGDLMTGDPIAVRPFDSVAQARRILTGSGLHALPVIDGEQTIGVVTLADCQPAEADDQLGDVVTGPAVTIDVTASISEAAAAMRTEYIHHLLVTEGDSPETIGILSSFDMLYLLTD